MTIHLVQISDCHLYRDPHQKLLGVNTLDSFKNVLNQLDQHIDVLVGSGDLVHDESELAYRRLSQLLSGRARYIATLPGNHDQPDMMAQCMQAASILYCGHLDLENWRLIFLNSHRTGWVNGYLSRQEMNRLQSLLNGTERHVLLFLHHQPVPVNSRWIDALSLSNGDQMMALLHRYPQVKGVAWGHVHQEWSGQSGNIQLFATPSTCVQFLPEKDEFSISNVPPGWRQFQLDQNGRIQSRVFYLSQQSAAIELSAQGY